MSDGSPNQPHLHRCVAFFPIALNKQIQRLKPFYPKVIETLGDHLRVKRLDDGLRQKDLAAVLCVSKEAIFLWENNQTTPPVKHLPLIYEYLTHCPIQTVNHFGEQFKLWRTFTKGYGLIETANMIGIYQKTLAKIEQQNVINHQRVLDLLNDFLIKHEFKFSQGHPHLLPYVRQGKSIPKFNNLVDQPKTLGQHLALARCRKNQAKVQVAQFNGISSEDVIRLWESGQTNPDARYYPKIMEYIGYCPIQYPETEAERLRLYRMHLGFSTRDVEHILNLPHVSVYRIESKGQSNCGHIEKLWAFYKLQT